MLNCELSDIFQCWTTSFANRLVERTDVRSAKNVKGPEISESQFDRTMNYAKIDNPLGVSVGDGPMDED
jgi:hypothetical protein